MRDDPRRPTGRPRIWASEADRKRAYRRRKQAELADQEATQAEARAARAAQRQAEVVAGRAEADARRWTQRAAAAERAAERARERARAAQETAQLLRAERDEARQLLAARWRSAGDAPRLRNDPDRLIAIIGDLRTEHHQCVRELRFARQLLGYPKDKPMPGVP